MNWQGNREKEEKEDDPGKGCSWDWDWEGEVGIESTHEVMEDGKGMGTSAQKTEQQDPWWALRHREELEGCSRRQRLRQAGAHSPAH